MLQAEDWCARKQVELRAEIALAADVGVLAPCMRAVRRFSPALMTALTFEPFKSVPASTTVIIGRKDALLAQSKLVPAGVPDAVWRALVDDAKPGDDGATASTTIVNSDGTCSTVVAGVLPEHLSLIHI